ncbi:LysR family transcriptional regulator [Paraburkholderia acidicola]|uniref:LysR family transcriptional regulator n=1 Tax=Paraburkholderia acidicola TaxID=1912599 RepID=A0A2A4EUI8_9BURK|nr:LysR family transcriptional regulator [Paraburkholderia acidicola]PCE25283.1 LysR family transcriptional regulator [Paraburkholderia acidicola]
MPSELINLAHLRTFMRVAQYGSATRAGQSLYRAQSAISRSIRTLEATIGAPLFERRASGMLPTRTGQSVLQRAEKVFAELDTSANASSLHESREHTSSCWGTPSYLMNSHRLQLVASLGRHLHMPTVARAFGVSQPAVSSAVKAVETGSGFRLFDRTAMGLKLTVEGEAFILRIRRALNELRLIPADIAALAGKVVGEVNIGALPLTRTSILPESIARLHGAFPEVVIRTDEGSYETLVADLLAGDIDFILGALRPVEKNSGLSCETLMSEEMVVLARKGHPLSDIPNITLAQLANANWILPRSHSPARAMLDNVFVQSQLRSPAPTVETGDLALTRELLLRTDMIAALSAQHWEHERQSGCLVALDLALPATRREIGFTFRADTLPSPAMQCAVNAIREVVNLRMPLANHV